LAPARHLAPAGHLPAATLPADKVASAVSKIRNTHMRKQFLAALRGLMKFAIDERIRADDPSAGIKVKIPKTEGFHTWEDDEIDQYRAFHPYGLLSRLIFELALELAARRRDIVLLGPQHMRPNGRIEYRQSKTGAFVSIEISAELQQAITRYRQPNGQLTFAATSFGKPRSYKGLSNTFSDWRAEAGLPKGRTLHGLRKGHCRIMAEAGCTEKEIMSHSGHKTMAEVQRYTEAASKLLLADNASAKMRQAQTKRSARVLAFPKKRARRKPD
jgi:integrase